MHTITVVNQKGGVGKTATTANLGAALAQLGMRVLLVDLDPQGHLTRSLGLPDAVDPATLPAAMLGQWSGELGELVAVQSPQMHVIPTSMQMVLLEPQLYARSGREWLLSRLLDAVAPVYDVCLLDCPPSLGALTDAAIVAARTDSNRTGGLLVPVQAEDSSLDALRLLLRQIETLADVLSLDVRLLGLVVSLYDARRGRIVTSVMDALQARGDVLAVIGDRREIREGWRLHAPVVEHAPESDAAGWYRDLATRLLPAPVGGGR